MEIESFFWACNSEISSFSIFPVNDFPYLLHVVKSHILIINIISMLPNVNSYISR